MPVGYPHSAGNTSAGLCGCPGGVTGAAALVRPQGSAATANGQGPQTVGFFPRASSLCRTRRRFAGPLRRLARWGIGTALPARGGAPLRHTPAVPLLRHNPLRGRQRNVRLPHILPWSGQVMRRYASVRSTFFVGAGNPAACNTVHPCATAYCRIIPQRWSLFWHF